EGAPAFVSLMLVEEDDGLAEFPEEKGVTCCGSVDPQTCGTIVHRRLQINTCAISRSSYSDVWLTRRVSGIRFPRKYAGLLRPLACGTRRPPNNQGATATEGSISAHRDWAAFRLLRRESPLGFRSMPHP